MNITDGTRGGSPLPRANVTLELVAGRCGGGECPTVYRTDRGTLVVQGYVFEAAEAGIPVPDGEGMVEVPTELLVELARAVA